MTRTDSDCPQRIGVVGAGQMGRGIAHVCAAAGLPVAMLDTDAAALERGMAAIGRQMERAVAKGRMTAEARDAALARITLGADHAAFGECDLVIEAATEREAVKREIYRAIVPHLGAEAILATNTSSIPITRLAAATPHPNRFIGMHFMNPVPAMALVEVIRGIATDDRTHARTLALTRRLGKTPAASEDFPGFLVNRVLLPMVNEAVCALHEGVGTVEAIDAALRLGANHRMGPLELADFIGLDTCLAIMRTLHEGMGDGKYRPCPLLVKYVEAGWLGRKSGRGFYDYGREPPMPTR